LIHGDLFQQGMECENIIPSGNITAQKSTHLVTLKIRSKRTHRSTDTPRGSIHSFLVKIISVIDPITTKQSNRLKSETKYP